MAEEKERKKEKKQSRLELKPNDGMKDKIMKMMISPKKKKEDK